MLYTGKNLHCQLQALGLREPGFVSTGVFDAAVHTPLVCKHFPLVWFRMTLNCIFSNNVICWCSRNGVQEKKKRVTEAFNVFQVIQSAVVGCLTGGWGLLKRGSSFNKKKESKKDLLLTICKAKNVPYGSRKNVQMQSLVTELISFS